MKSRLEIESDDAEAITEAISPSLETDDNVNYSVRFSEGQIKVRSETDTLGRLRGVTDNALRLSLLSKKILDR